MTGMNSGVPSPTFFFSVARLALFASVFSTSPSTPPTPPTPSTPSRHPFPPEGFLGRIQSLLHSLLLSQSTYQHSIHSHRVHFSLGAKQDSTQLLTGQETCSTTRIAFTHTLSPSKIHTKGAVGVDLHRALLKSYATSSLLRTTA